jgi:hypothetical protein
MSDDPWQSGKLPTNAVRKHRKWLKHLSQEDAYIFYFDNVIVDRVLYAAHIQRGDGISKRLVPKNDAEDIYHRRKFQ